MPQLFVLPLILISREETGRDASNRPIMSETKTPVRGYFWQGAGVEAQSGGAVVVAEDVKIAILPTVTPKANDQISHLGTVWNIVGPPEPKWSLARGTKRIHHWELRCRRAEA